MRDRILEGLLVVQTALDDIKDLVATGDTEHALEKIDKMREVCVGIGHIIMENNASE